MIEIHVYTEATNNSFSKQQQKFTFTQKLQITASQNNNNKKCSKRRQKRKNAEANT